METRGMKRGVCLLLAVLLLWTAVPAVAVDVEPLGFRTEPMVAAGGSHTMALRNDGTLWSWGANWDGQLGDGTTIERTNPVRVQGLTNMTAVSAGMGHNVALRSDGTVWTWGGNWYGYLGDGTMENRRITPAQVQGLTNMTAVSAGRYHTVTLRNDGTVWAFGAGWDGQLGDGTMMERTTPAQVRGLANVTAIATGWHHTVALRSDGTVWTFGAGLDGQLGDGTTNSRGTPVQVRNLTNVIAIAAGRYHTVALRSDGTVWSWGSNWNGELGHGTAGVMYHSTRPAQVRQLANVTSVTAGDFYTVALRDDGTVWSWGLNWSGNLGDGTMTDRLTPVQAKGLTNVTGITAGYFHAVALRDDGTVWAWGEDGTQKWNWENQEWEDFHNNLNTVPTQVRGPGGSGFLDLGTPPTPGRTRFNDVFLDDWFHDAVEFADTYNIMQGTSATAFSPRADFSRAQVVATLYRMEHGGTAREIPYAHNRPVFHDVEVGAWYSPYVIWAYDYDIVAGIGGNRFGPDRPVTREQLAAMLHRFAGFTGHDTTANPGPQWGSFTDLYRIGNWAGAREALIWANSHGLITGRSATSIAPGGTAQRAEAAAILMRFIQTLGTAAPTAAQAIG